jgi:Polyketide cyclase / dehydrase and lipid transport
MCRIRRPYPPGNPTRSNSGRSRPGPVEVGTRFANRKRFLGYRFRTVTECTGREPPSEFSFASIQGQRYRFTYRFSPTPSGTGVRVDAEFPHLRGLLALYPRRLLRRAIAKELRENHARLKRLLESRS